LHETLAGDGLANVTATRVPADAPARMSLEAHEARMIGRYRVHQPILRQLGALALIARAGVRGALLEQVGGVVAVRRN